MLSRTSEYVLRAMAFMAQQVDGWPLPGPRIAEQAGIPRKYLSNILGSLVRAGILESAPGVGGGFRNDAVAKGRVSSRSARTVRACSWADSPLSVRATTVQRHGIVRRARTMAASVRVP